MQSVDQAQRITRTQQVRREDIIRAAIATINKDGYAGTSIKRIANAAGTAKSTVLYHFVSKQALMNAIIGDVYESGAAYMGTAIRQQFTARAKLRAYITSNVRYIADHVEQITAIHQIIQNMPRESYDEAPEQALQAMLEKGQKSGEFGVFDAHVVAVAIRLLIDSSSFYIIETPDLDIDAYASEIAALFDRSLTAKKA